MKKLIPIAAALLFACSPNPTPQDGGGTDDGGAQTSDGGTGTDGGSSEDGGTQADGGTTRADGGAEDGGEELDAGPKVTCGAGPQVTGPLYVDATNAWNLSRDGGLGVVGNRISAADLDHDGYPDLVVHAITSNLRQSTDGGRRLVWMLMNRAGADGGRMFVDATVDSGFFQVRGGSTTQLRSAQLAVFADIDNDGDLDGFSGTNTDPTTPATDPGDRSEVMINDGQANFSLAPPSAPHPAATELLPLTGASFIDSDRDGKIDLFAGYWYQRYGYSHLGTQAQLFKGSADGLFTAVTAAAGLLTDTTGFANNTSHRPAYGVTACDLDNDGSGELIVTAYGRQWNHLWANDGTGKFIERGRPAGFASDQITDYKDNQFFACYCTAHPMQADCIGTPPAVIGCPTPADSYWSVGSDDQPFRLNGNSFTTWCGDVDNDGDNDLYNAAIKHWHIGDSSDSSGLLVNKSTKGNFQFDRPGNQATGMIWPHPGSWNEGGLMAAGGDLDNDGRQEVVVAASDYPDQFGLVFHQLPNGTFTESGQSWGLHHACVSGLAIADFDRDGDLDVVVGSGTARDCSLTWKANEVHLYENKGTTGSWLLLELAGDGVTANKSAIGAKVTVKAGGQTWTREVGGGYGHMGMQNDTVVHVGIAGCPSVDEVTVRWPNAALTTQTWRGLDGKKFYRLEQGKAAATLALP
jgi:hypothetical protein